MDRGFLETSYTSLYGQAYSANRWPPATSAKLSGSHSGSSTGSFQNSRSTGGSIGGRDTRGSSSVPSAGMNNGGVFSAAAAAAAASGAAGGPGSWGYQPAPALIPAAAAAAGGGGTSSMPGNAAAATVSAAQLIAQKSLRLRDLKRFRKVDLDQVCRDIGVAHSGLKMDVYNRVVQHIEDLCRTINHPAQAARLRRVYDSIARLANTPSRSSASPPYGRTPVVSLGVSFPGPGGSSSGSFRSYSVPGTGVVAAAAAPMAAGGASAQVIAQADREVLRHFESNAFLRPQDTVAGPQRLRPTGIGRSSGTIMFNLSAADLDKIKRSAAEPRTQPGALRLMLRSARAGGAVARAAASSAGSASGGATADGDWQLWPAETQVQVNGNFVQVKQRRVFFQGSTKKLKGDCEPFDIASLCRAGNNRIEINCNDVEPFVFAVQLVQNVGVEEVLETIRRRPTDSVEEGVKRVRRSFRGLPLDGSGGDGDIAAAAAAAAAGAKADDSDDELMATSTRLSLRCPLGLVPIRVPSRGRHCGHLQCFDLGTFLSFTERNSGAGWRCGVCHRLMAPDDVVVDTFLLGVVQRLGSRVDDVEEVDIFPDGRWEPGSAGDSGGGGGRAERRRAAAAAAAGGSSASSAAAPGAGTGSPVLLDLEDMVEGDGGGDDSHSRVSSGGLAAAAVAPAAAPAPASAGVVDLSLSDDEDEEDRPISSLASGSGGGGGSGGSSAGGRSAVAIPSRGAVLNPYASRSEAGKGAAAGSGSAAASRQYNPTSSNAGSSGTNGSSGGGGSFGGFSASAFTPSSPAYRPSSPAYSGTVRFGLPHGSGPSGAVWDPPISNGKRAQQQQQQDRTDRSADAVLAAGTFPPPPLQPWMAWPAEGGSSGSGGSSSTAPTANGAAAAAAAGSGRGNSTLVASTTATGVYIPQSPPAAAGRGSAGARTSPSPPSPALAFEPAVGQAYKRARVEQLEERERSQYTGLEAAAAAIGNPFDFGFGGGCGSSKSAAGGASSGASQHPQPRPAGPLRANSFDGLEGANQEGQESMDPVDYLSAMQSFQDS